MKYIAIYVGLLMYTCSFAQSIDHFETIIQTGQTVKYIVPTEEPNASWNTNSFNDSDWLSGITGIGYGDDDDNTVLDNSNGIPSVYIRQHFSVSSPEHISQLILDMDFDDGFVAYLNGSEIARFNMGASNSQTSFNQTLSQDIEANLYRGISPYRFILSTEALQLLQTGENLFALEVHNVSTSSSDLSANPFLHAGIVTTETFFHSSPHWFSPPVTDYGNLPLVLINTLDQSVQNDARIQAKMGLIYNGPGEINAIYDTPNVYDGYVSMEIRGASSSGFPKKSYTIETELENGDNQNVSLLGMPKDNDFVLYAPYSDKSLVRNLLSYDIYRLMGHWSPRTRIVNLVLNNNYQGIYILTEKVKVEDDRVDIKKITPDDISAKDISGGYILQIDRTNKLDASEYWESPTSPPYSGFGKNTFEYSDPKRRNLTSEQANYIKAWINNLDAVLASSYYKHETIGYRKYINVPSFVDYFIFHEFNKDVDAYRLSTYFYKTSDYRDGKLHAGPPWDYNLTYGNMDYGTNINKSYDWMYRLTASKYWWKRLIEDPWFENEVTCRWAETRERFLNPETLNTMIDDYVHTMGESIDRNFEKWPILGTYVWPNYYIGNTHEEEITWLKSWISDRINWLDQEWLGDCKPSTIATFQESQDPFRIYPNPTKTEFILSLNTELNEETTLQIFNNLGQKLFEQQILERSTKLNAKQLALYPGIYHVIITSPGSSFSQKLIIQ